MTAAHIDFASAASAQLSSELESDLTVSVRANGDMYLQTRPVTSASLAHELRDARRHHRHPPTLRLRIDRSAPFRCARTVAVAAREAGFARFTVMVRNDEGL